MKLPELVGIVNVTPDSFSDGGQALDVASAHRRIEQLAADGASVIDIGAESTRPGATPLTWREEWERLGPVLNSLTKPKNVAISIDTRHAETAKRALDLGVDWINDVSGFAADVMIEVVKPYDCKLVMMHSITVPPDKENVLPDWMDVPLFLVNWAMSRRAILETSGIAPARVIFDPGLGFGKTADQNWEILRGILRIKSLDIAVLIGHSRKSFLGDPATRDAETLRVSKFLLDTGVEYLRVHDVAAHKRLLDEARV